MKVYVCSKWSPYYDSSDGSWDIQAIFFTEEEAKEWKESVGLGIDRDYEEYEIEQPPVPSSRIENATQAKIAQTLWEKRINPIKQLIYELCNEYDSSLANEYNEPGNEVTKRRIFDLIVSSIYDGIFGEKD